MGNTYYEYRNVKVKIAHRLMKMDGWKVYGYKADDSDIMTDYYSPANWHGVAEKNGYILVVDVDRERKEPEYYTVRTTKQAKTDADTAAKIEKLEQMTQARGASEQEEATARAKIEALRNKKAESDEATTEKILHCPAHKANPPRCNWHIEKDGIILDKGNGLLKFSDVPDISGYGYTWELESWQNFNNMTAEEWKDDFIEEYTYRWGEKEREFAEKCAESRYETEKERYALLDKFNALIARWNNICGGMVSNGSGEDGYVYEEITVIKHKTELKPQECAGSIKEGQCFILKSNFTHGKHRGYVYRIHEYSYTDKDGKNHITYKAYRLGKGYKKERTGTADNSNCFYLYDIEKFEGWIAKGAIAFCELVEVKTPYEVKKVVKKAVKTEEKSKTENQDKEAQAKKITIEAEKEQEEKRNNYEEIKRQVTSFVYGSSEKLNIEIEHGHYVELIRDGEKISYGSSGYDDVLDKENSIEYTMAEIEECRNYGWNVISIIETTPQAPETPATDETEEIPTEGAETVGNVTDEPHTAAGASPDMFAELARAYVEGKTAPNHKKKADTPSPVSKTDTEETPEENSDTPSGVQKDDTEELKDSEKESYGFFGSSEYFTAQEIAQLQNGEQITATDERGRSETYFSTPYHLDGSRIVFRLPAAGYEARYVGFIVNNLFYDGNCEISKEIVADINTEIKRLLPDEEAAKANAGELTEGEQKNITYYLENDFMQDAKNHFFKGKAPELHLYTHVDDFSCEEQIKYILNPIGYVQEQAREYISGYHRVVLYEKYIQYNRTAETLEKIKADVNSEPQLFKRIMDSIGHEKSVKIELANGHTVKVGADAVKRIGYCGHVSSWDVSACDRQYLDKDEYSGQNIKVNDIVQITHGRRILYSAA